jgi:hypothetical protein
VSREGPVSSRDDTGVTCAGPGCEKPIDQGGPGRPARFCSPACRSAAHRARQRTERPPVSVEVDMGSASSRGRHPDQAWMVRIRRGERSVIVVIALNRRSADGLAGKIADVLGAPAPVGSRLGE